MRVGLRTYNADEDFGRIRDFLVDTFALFDKPINWRLERWNYARYFVAPFLANYGQKRPRSEDCRRAIRLWEELTGVWETETGEIVGVANIEHPDPSHGGWGEAFFQRHPNYEFLLPEMLDYAEEHLRNREKNLLYFHVYEHDGRLQTLAQERGYELNREYQGHDSVFTVEGELPEPGLPEGYVVQSMADHNDLDRRRRAFGLGFNHTDPREWPSLLSYQELQQAPDYRKDMDLYVVAPDGEHAAFCIVWWDEGNCIANLEPVGTVPAYRRKGLARAVVLEAIRRVADLGAERVFVGSGQEFYTAIGFKPEYLSHRWEKRF